MLSNLNTYHGKSSKFAVSWILNHEAISAKLNLRHNQILLDSVAVLMCHEQRATPLQASTGIVGCIACKPFSWDLNFAMWVDFLSRRSAFKEEVDASIGMEGRFTIRNVESA